jgi:hypothetical protein
MTKQQQQNYFRLQQRLDDCGFLLTEVDALLKIEQALHRWHELQCNEDVEIDAKGKATLRGQHNGKTYTIRNTYTPTILRLDEMMQRHPNYSYYVQGDPRGCSLYVYDVAALEGLDIDAYYSSRGIAICI